MAMFGILLDKDVAVTKWIADTKKRTTYDNVFKNPFKTKIRFWNKKGEVLLLMDITPIYFNYSIYGWFMSAGTLLLFGFGWWMWPGIVLGCLGLFWTSEFYFVMTKLGLRRTGYKGKIKRMKLSRLIREVVL
jgi:hypothetical protein